MTGELESSLIHYTRGRSRFSIRKKSRRKIDERSRERGREEVVARPFMILHQLRRQVKPEHLIKALRRAEHQRP